MRIATVVSIVIGIGMLVLLKVFQDSIPRNSDPQSNVLILIGFVLFVMIYGASRLRQNRKSSNK
ncbi:hypothetical protein [Sporosarcina sp. NPDC096371]|uniref:hypothetical protein n=1 Tax=Sporosarcina sp. NPDC096371 TaxID=3364530 RepID=UPI0038101EC8